MSTRDHVILFLTAYIKKLQTKGKHPMNIITQKQLEEGLTKKDKQTIFFAEESAAETLAKKIKERNTYLDKPATEYRYENTDVGQGHYFTDLTDCLSAARHNSIEHPTQTFKIEAFRPKRYPIATILNNVLSYVSDTDTDNTSEEIRRLRKSNYGRQSIPEICANLFMIAMSKCINQPAHREASLYNAIDILEDLDKKQRSIK